MASIGRATVYFSCGANYEGIEARDLAWRYVPYVHRQYALEITLSIKGVSSKQTLLFLDSNVVMLEGWGHKHPPPRIEPGLDIPRTRAGVIAAPVRYPWFSKKWQDEFDSFLRELLAAGAHLIADFRKP